MKTELGVINKLAGKGASGDKRMIVRIMLSYAFTFAVIYLADTVSIIIDGLIVSRGISPTALAAVGIADPTFKAVSLFCGVFAAGMRSACSAFMVREELSG